MNAVEWEETVQKIVDESNQEAKGGGKNRILMAWRAKLECEPALLSPHQIDLIVREVRRRLDDFRAPPKNGARR
jgi:hypothetical protein